MKRFSVISLIFSLLFILSCEDKKDTTPPEVTITSPTNGSKVNEVITVSCMSTDNKEVSKVELWVDGVNTGLTDETEPYSFQWNTTTYKDGDHTLIVRGYDSSDNEGDSPPITVKVDNTVSVPKGVSVKSVNFLNGGFSIDWSKSTDGDFKSYSVEHSIESGMEDYEDIFTTEDVNVTNTRMENTSPLTFHYFRVTVTDTFLYQTKGSIYSTSLDPIPDSVDVKSVIYDLEKMTVEWSESNVGDFGSYKLLYSKTESGERETINTYIDKTVISYSTTTYDPTIENWYWVMVSDTLGQSNVGNGKTNTIDSPPTTPILNDIVYEPVNSVFKISWGQNTDDDFNSYILYERETEGSSGNDPIKFTSTDNSVTSLDVNIDRDLIRYYYLDVEDKWGLQSRSSQKIGDSRNMFLMTYGGGEGKTVRQTTDGGYIITGNKNGGIGLIKTDFNGTEEWNKSFIDGWLYGGGTKVQQTIDGGFIIVGFKYVDSHGEDILLIKTDSNGTEEWNKTIGGSDPDLGYSVQQTTDGGYIITGHTSSFGNGKSDVWLVKTDSDGNEEWNKTFGGSDDDVGYSVKQTTDGGYIITGNTTIWRYQGSSKHEILLIKTDSQGTEEWNKTFGGNHRDRGHSVQQTIDGGYIITGQITNQPSQHTQSSENVGLIKTNSQGDEEWSKCFGGNHYDGGKSVQQTTDGGFIITGFNQSYGLGGVFLVKTDSNGNEEWNTTLGNNNFDIGYSVQQTTDGGYIITGKVESQIGLIKTNSKGEMTK